MIDKDIMLYEKARPMKGLFNGHLWEKLQPKTTTTTQESIEHFKRLAAEPKRETPEPSKEFWESYEKWKKQQGGGR